MEHWELAAEMQHIEKLTTQERLRLAHKRRMQQLKRWSQREKEWTSKRNKMLQNEQRKKHGRSNRVHFVNSVMLLEAAGRNDVEEVRQLLMQKVSPDSTNEDGLTALHQCCIDDNEEMMKLLIEYGADVNAEDSEKWTPLHAAATCGHLHLVQYLISKNADLLAVNADGNMPYDICEDDTTLDYIETEMARRGVTQELIEEIRSATERTMLADLESRLSQGHDLEQRDSYGATPLHIASAHGYLRVVEFLLDNHVSTDVRDDDGWQPIHAAACWGHPDILETLVQNGADLDAKTRNNETPQDICEDPDLKERIIQLRTEQESKRQQDAQRKKIRRSQSANTRTQSIRRTSYREKNLTSKKEAVEEAKIRIKLGLDEPPEQPTPLIVDNKEAEEYPQAEEDEEDPSVAMFVQLKRDTHGEVKLSQMEKEKLQRLEIENTTFEHKTEEWSGKTDTLRSNKQDGLSPSTTTTDSSNKIDIHVSVTINTGSSSSSSYNPSPGTLADLKKQRSLSRNTSSQLLNGSGGSPSNNNNYTFSSTDAAMGNGSFGDAHKSAYDAPHSPTLSLRRFAGAPSEVIGKPEKNGCCTLM